MFKSGSVSVKKVSGPPSTVEIHEQQSQSVQTVESIKPNAIDVKDHDDHERHLSYWLGSTYESIKVLIEIYARVLPNLIKDKEMHAGIVVLHGIAQTMAQKLEPVVDKYGEKKSYGRNVSLSLKDILFPKRVERLGSYEVLATLQGLKMYYNHIDGHLLALWPAAKALWDKDFIERVEFCQKQIERLEAWANEHLKVKAPQSLIVPDKGFGGSALFGDGEGCGLHGGVRASNGVSNFPHANGTSHDENGHHDGEPKWPPEGAMNGTKRRRKSSHVMELAPLQEDVSMGEAADTMLR